MPTRLSRYVLRELARPFAFFLLVLTAVIWLTQSLGVIEIVVNSGQSAGLFLQFVALLAPAALAIVLPLAAFAATLYAVHRLFGESELVAMIAAGMSPAALARPVALFGALVALAVAFCTIYAAPAATREMRERIANLRGDIANALVFEGQFLHPAPGLTIYVRENSGSGEMTGLFVHDQRDPEAEVTYTARRAVLARAEGGPRIMMQDGAAQRRDVENGALSVLRFDELVFDLGQFMSAAGDRAPKVSERSLAELVAPDRAALGDAADRALGRFYAEGHDRLSAPLYAVALPLIALATVIAGGFSRRGYGKRIALAVLIGVSVRVLGFAAKAMAAGAPATWPLLYFPPLIAILGALWALSRETGVPRHPAMRAAGGAS
ncbi:LPS export ABC transporter permease LptF [Rubrimonas cliftonensis]|uniref:Lipopolysaccharide export system permease protein n=1 Tax=Rubrimonas cliftonensis TaxID=89524 RepID=A0A1H3W1Y1_9RHOB|nr:LPS export ABC transporter permease LptF [Rubrimonas cliftonensis]SDZ80328.1 lipopolysaccharide export system permease protein [Rubrimonas cliftonensis]